MSRLLLGPSTRSTTVWIAFDSMDGGCTSVGPFGLLLMDVRSPHAVLASSAARTLRIWCLMIVLLFPSGSRPHGQSEAERSEEHTSELQSQSNLVCRLLLEKKKHHLRPLHTSQHHTQ